MKKLLMITAAAGMLASAASAQEMTLAGAQALLTEVPGASSCSAPSAPAIPDGASVSEAEIMEAIGAFQNYQSDSQAYRDCLDAAASNMGEGLTEQHNAAVTMVYDTNASEVEAVGADMNAQIQAYNAANPD